MQNFLKVLMVGVLILSFGSFGQADGIDEHTLLLIQSDTYDGDTNFTDSSGKQVLTNYGNPTHSTYDPPLNTSSSIYFDGNSSINTTGNQDFLFGPDEFTIDFWAKKPENTLANFMSLSEQTGNHLEHSFNIYPYGSSLYIRLYQGTSIFQVNTGYGPLNDGQWHHVAFERDNSGVQDRVNSYIDGQLKESKIIYGPINSTIAPLRIGGGHPRHGYFTKGYMDEIRISNIARYRGQSFSRPTAPYTPPGVQLPFNPSGTHDTTIYLTVEAGKTVTIDWGNGNETTVIGTGSREEHNDESASGISINGDLDGILTFKADGQTFLSGDIDTFSSLTNLRRLEMNFTGVEGNISSLSGLTDLEYIGLSNSSGNRTIFSKTGDLASLQNLTNLKYLAMYNTEVSGDISELSGLTNLEELWLYSSNISGDIVNFNNLTNLKYLWAYNTGINGSISDLNSLTNLQHLMVNSTSVGGNIAELSTLVNLKWLWVHYSGVGGDIAGLGGLTQLEWFRARVSNVSYIDTNADLSGWANCSNFDFYSCSWPTIMIDNFLNKLNDDLNSTNVTLILNGNNDPRTSASDIAYDELSDQSTKNWTIYVN